MTEYKQLSTIIVTVLITGIIAGLAAKTWYQKQQLPLEPQQISIFEAYDCDKLRTKNIKISAKEDPIKASLRYLQGPGSYSTIAEYSRSFKIENGTAFIDWPGSMIHLQNIDTACALQAFFNPIEKTLTQYRSIQKVMHSMDGSVSDFYLRLGLVCPEGVGDCKTITPPPNKEDLRN